MCSFRCREHARAWGAATFLRGLFQTRGGSNSVACTCGAPLPDLQYLLVAFVGSEETAFLLGQCSSCGTVFWDDT